MYEFRPPMFRFAYDRMSKEDQYRHNAASVIQEWWMNKIYEYDEDQYCWRHCMYFCVCQYA